MSLNSTGWPGIALQIRAKCQHHPKFTVVSVAWMKSSRQEAWCSHQCSKRIRFYPQCLNWICHPLPARQLRHELLQHQVVELHVFTRCFFPRPGDLRAQRTAHRAVKGATSLSMWRVWPLEKNPRWSQATKNEFGNQTTSTGSCSVFLAPSLWFSEKTALPFASVWGGCRESC